MTNYDKLKKDTSFYEFAQWLDKHCDFDSSPWNFWFTKNYCARCPDETVQYTYSNGETHDCPCAWCEKYNNCYFFPERNCEGPPSCLDILELWLRAEVEENEDLLL